MNMDSTLGAVPNASGIFPMGYNVLVLPKKVEEKTKGGIYLPEDTKEKEQFAAMEGQLVAVSPMAFSHAEWPDGAEKPQAGQRVVFSRYSGVRHKGADGEEYVVLRDDDILAVMA